MTTEANTVAPPKGQTIAQVLRALKPFLPAGYSKISERGSVGYFYADRLSIEVFGVCAWNASTQEKEGCHATSIRITPWGSYRKTRYDPGLRTTTHKPRKDGTFKLDSIGARLQFCLAQIEVLVKQRAEAEKAKAAEAQATKELRAEVKAYLAAEGLNMSVLDEYRGGPLFPRASTGGDPEDEEQDDSDWDRNKEVLRATIKNGPKRVNLSLEGLTLDEMVRVLRVLTPRRVETKPLRSRGRRSR